MSAPYTDPGAVRFQRLCIAILALVALVWQRLEPLYGILALNAPGLLWGARGAPAILLYRGLSRLLGGPFLKAPASQRSAVVLFAQSPALDRFIYALFTVTVLGLLALASVWPQAVWVFSGYMAAMMFLSATVGFCMGAVLFVGVNRLLARLGVKPLGERT